MHAKDVCYCEWSIHKVYHHHLCLACEEYFDKSIIIIS